MKINVSSALSLSDKAKLATISMLWLIANYFYWSWWLAQGGTGSPVLFCFFSIASLYTVTFLPSMYIFYLWNMAQAEHIPVEIAEEMGVVRKVAMITPTVVGAESTEVVERQLLAMSQVEYPHDNFLLVDKKHSEELKALCEKYGVVYFCRHDPIWGEEQIKKWNAPNPPFKAKTKAGNVNAWFDAYGRNYTHITQLDIDHNPRPNYLHMVLGYFVDPKTKWVQGPSVYGNMQYWTARGSAEQELVLQGPLQMGFYGWSGTPFIIGSHCTYDVLAIFEIGGFQPTRAEDHLDTIELAALGYRGVFVPEIIAVGDGPETFGTYLGQQFAWAYSLMVILFWNTPRLLGKYGPKRIIQILFAQTWYPAWSLSTLGLFLLPAIGILTNSNIANVHFLSYIQHSSPLAVIGFAVWIFSKKWQEPKGLGLSWRGVILHIARWPVIVSALVQVLLKVEKPYMITPKGMTDGEEFSIKMHLFYLVLISINLLAVFVGLLIKSNVMTYSLFALMGAAFLLLVYITVLVKTGGWHNPKTWVKRTPAMGVFAVYAVVLIGALIMVLPNLHV